MGLTPDQLVQDKDFMAAPPSEQTQYLSQFDSDFARATPQDQHGYLQFLRQHTPEAQQGRAMAMQPPSVPNPGKTLVRQWDQAHSPTAGLPGSSPNPVAATPGYTAAVGLPVAAAAAATLPATAPGLLTAAKGALKALPTIGAMEGISYLRQHAPFGKYIPSGAEWLPMFLGGHGEPEPKEAQPKDINDPFRSVPEPVPDPFRETRPVSQQTAQPVGASIARPADIPAPYRIGPGAIPPDVVAAPNPRILAGNQGIRTTPIAMLPERAGEDRLGSSAMMQHEGLPAILPKTAPAPVRIGRPDVLDDQAMQEAMNSDLESHGAQARREMNLERRARNDVAKPKWQLQAEAKAQQLLEQAQKKAEERTLARELGKGQPKIAKPTKQGPPAVKVTGKEEDLTPLLKESLAAVKKKKGR